MEFLYQAIRKGGLYPPTSAFPNLGHEWLSQSISAVASASLAEKRRTQFDTFHQETLERHGIETEYHGVDWTRMPDVTHEADVQMEQGVQGHEPEASHHPPPPPLQRQQLSTASRSIPILGHMEEALPLAMPGKQQLRSRSSQQSIRASTGRFPTKRWRRRS